MKEKEREKENSTIPEYKAEFESSYSRSSFFLEQLFHISLKILWGFRDPLLNYFFSL